MLTTRFYQKLLSAVFVVFLFTAYAGQEADSKTLSGAEMPDTSLSSSDPVEETTSETPESIESVYTSLALEDCEVLETYEESGGRLWRCDGYQDIPLYVTDEDARFDVDAGVPNAEWTTAGRPFNSIGDTVEWRLHGGKPVAAILRYNFMTDGIDPTRTSELAVSAIGREGSPGCLVEWVKADAYPNQNTAARQIADQRAEDFDCESSSPEPSDGEPAAELEEDKTVELTFGIGSNRTTISDTLAEFAIHDYLVRASADQTLRATLRSNGPATVIVIENDGYQPDAVAVKALPATTTEAVTNGAGESSGWVWEGDLLSDGVYRIRVIHSGPAANQGAVSPYALDINII